MNRKFKFILFALLVLGQVVIHRYILQLNLNLDLLYLILVYVSVKSPFYKSIFTGTVIGLVTDYLSGNVMGVFGFSRTVAAYLLNEISMRIDLKSNVFVFMLISLSLAFSNLVANVFFYFIRGYALDPGLIFYQPLLTGVLGLLIVSPSKAKTYLDVY
ncbi:MAG: rod shape-determining protein MreD [bacterium]|nr:rod shape-determining protein MreD [bacterium]